MVCTREAEATRARSLTSHPLSRAAAIQGYLNKHLWNELANMTLSTQLFKLFKQSSLRLSCVLAQRSKGCMS